MKKDSFYEALGMQAQAAIIAVPEMSEHRFSRRYERKKKLLIKAYKRSLDRRESISVTFRRLRLRGKIRLAFIIVLSVLLLTGAGVYITHHIGEITAKQYRDHTIARIEVEGAPEEITDRYVIGYDLGGFTKEIVSDESNEYWEIWENESKRVSFAYYIKHGLTVSMNTEGSGVEIVDINWHEAFHFMPRQDMHCLAWDNGDYWFEFDFSGIDYETGIEIAESIKKN